MVVLFVHKQLVGVWLVLWSCLGDITFMLQMQCSMQFCSLHVMWSMCICASRNDNFVCKKKCVYVLLQRHLAFLQLELINDSLPSGMPGLWNTSHFIKHWSCECVDRTAHHSKFETTITMSVMAHDGASKHVFWWGLCLMHSSMGFCWVWKSLVINSSVN